MAGKTKSSNQWFTIGPILALSILSLALFSIAAIIILSLIPVYLSNKNVSVTPIRSETLSSRFLLVNNAVVQNGDTLSTSARTSLTNQIQNAMQLNSQIGNGVSIDVKSGTVSSTARSNKRRQIPNLYAVLIYQIIFQPTKCSTKLCRNKILTYIKQLFSQLILTVPSLSQSSDNTIINNITTISAFWSRLSPYTDNDANIFGVQNIGLPNGCQIEQVHVLHRNGERLPSSDEFQLMNTFASRVTTVKNTFTGPLSYLNTWSLQLTTGDLLAEGVSSEFSSGTDFWVNYGRILYNAARGQPFYNGSGQMKPVLRSSDTKYLVESTKMWAKGFFYILNSPESLYTLVTIPSSSGNNTLESYRSCSNYDNSSYGLDALPTQYVNLLPTFLQSAVTRLSTYAPSYTNFSATDVFTLQLLCIYEYHAFDNSDACSLFTQTEWQGFEYILDILGYYGYSFGQPAGRALGLGYLQELLARLNQQYITTSHSSVNTTLDSSSITFPLNQTFYLDMTDGSTIISFLTALSLDYFRQDKPIQSVLPTNRTFRLGQMVPFSGRLIIEKIGCTQTNPTANNFNHTFYSPSQYGYSSASATNKFVRIRLNNGILPLNSIRGGLCAGRTDGLCSLSNFVNSQNNATTQANYQFVCFSSYTYDQTRFDEDGTYFVSS